MSRTGYQDRSAQGRPSLGRLLAGRSIRSQILLVFVLAIVPLSVASGLLALLVQSMLAQAQAVFDDSVFLDELGAVVADVDDQLANYLTLRNHETLVDYYRASSSLEAAIARLPDRRTADQQMLERRVLRRLLLRYQEEADRAVAARRGRLVQAYADAYRDVTELRVLVEASIDRLNRDGFSFGLSRFREASALLSAIVLRSALMLALLAGLGVALIALFARRIAGPIAALSEHARTVAAGAFRTPDFFPAAGSREVEQLSRAHNRMKKSMSSYIDELNHKADVERRLMEQNIQNLRMKSALRSAELIALQTQINPHFFYNTLNTAVQLAAQENAERTTEYLDHLADAYRYLLSSPEQPVTIAQELQALDKYLYVLRIRFGARITFRVDAEPRTLKQRIPPLILQPLVENAVLHGLKDREEGGLVEISVRVADDRTCISVSDNGTGMDRAVLQDLRERLREEDEAVHVAREGRGIGLVNVFERLTLFHHSYDAARIESVPGEGTRIEFRFPYHQEREEAS